MEGLNIARYFWLEYKKYGNGNEDFIRIIKTWQVHAFKFLLRMLILK